MKQHNGVTIAVVWVCLICLAMTQPANGQTKRWDFNSGVENWEEGNNVEILQNNDGILTISPTWSSFRIFHNHFSTPKLIKTITIRLKCHFDIFVSAHARAFNSSSVTNKIALHPTEDNDYQECTLVFKEAAKGVSYLSISFKYAQTDLEIDWIETSGPVESGNDFNLTVDPPSDIIQKGQQKEFDVNADWPSGGMTPTARYRNASEAIAVSSLNIIEDSPFGEIVNLEVGDASASAKFLFEARELGHHIVNFKATLEEVPGAPLEYDFQLPLYVAEFDPDTLFEDLSGLDEWMLYKE